MVVDGRSIRSNLIESFKEEIINNNYEIKLAIIYLGNDEASKIYVNNKKKVCELVGIKCDIYTYDYITEKDLKDLIVRLNEDKTVTGIMVELPLPLEFNKEEIINLISPNKDVDGLCSNNLVMPCTALAVLKILEYYNININNKKITLVGYSSLIGKPLEKYFLENNISIDVCNTKTLDLKEHIKNADIIITATGVYNLITEDMIKENAVIIDCGIIRKDNKIHGDVDFDNIKNKCSLITPVPNGVGPITTAMVINNLIELYKK